MDFCLLFVVFYGYSAHLEFCLVIRSHVFLNVLYKLGQTAAVQCQGNHIALDVLVWYRAYYVWHFVRSNNSTYIAMVEMANLPNLNLCDEVQGCALGACLKYP